ncbi:MAG: hypothetical protein ACU88J_01660 [Gammaproteobacteria bacterium]
MRTRVQLGEVETGYAYFREGDETIAKITPCFENGKGAVMRGLFGGVGFGTTELIVARPKPFETTVNYLHWLFILMWFRIHGESSMYGAGGQKRVPDVDKQLSKSVGSGFDRAQALFPADVVNRPETGKD